MRRATSSPSIVRSTSAGTSCRQATDRPLTWNNSQRLVGDPAEAVARLKASVGPDLLIQGSSMLYQALLPARLVDQLALITFPVMLGRGKRWYSGDPATARSWTLVEQ